jgi:branched-chain amino acid aminotransferase
MSLIPFDDRDGVIWFDGKLVPWRDAKIHVLTHGLHYGSCVFEGERVYGGTVFKLTEHDRRLHESARLLEFELPYSVEVLDEATRQLVAANGVVDGYVRPVAWRGSEMMSVGAQQSRIHVAIATWQWPSYFSAEARMRGIRLTISKWQRPSPQSAPTAAKAAGLYMICTMSKHAAENEGYDDALMYDYRGLVAEATGANMFFVIDGQVHTPTPDCFLNGITRQTVIDLARRRGITVVERHIPAEDLARASEVFVTGSAAEVTPVREIGPHNYQPGQISRQLMEDYGRLVRQQPLE